MNSSSFLGDFDPAMILRKSLDVITIWYVIQKVSRYHQKIYVKFLAFMVHTVDI